MDKAFIAKSTFGKNDGTWGFYVDVVLVMNGNAFSCAALSDPDSSQPPGGWKAMIRDVVAAEALSQFAVAIDEVMFGDYTSLPVP